jgi:uncharacterized protein (DUF2267 family)
MQLHEFLSRVQQQARLASPEQAMAATRATLETLSERIWGGEPQDLGSQLPQLLKGYLHAGEGHRFNVEEFFRKVAAREGIDPVTGRRHAQAVLRTVEQAIDHGEMSDLMAQLPKEYHHLFDQDDARPG